jgi:hypothetical protein
MQDSDFRTEIGSRKNTRLSAVLCASGARWKTFQLAMAFSFACEILNLIKHQGTSGNTRGLQFHVASSTEARSRFAMPRDAFGFQTNRRLRGRIFPPRSKQERAHILLHMETSTDFSNSSTTFL